MVVDSSALLAILLGEAGADQLVDAIDSAELRRVPAPTLVEASAVMIGRKGPPGDVALDALLQRLALEVVAMTPEAAAHARIAYGRYGKGVGQPAVLNYGDCLAYGVARALDAPLLFVGEDFGRTDVQPAID